MAKQDFPPDIDRRRLLVTYGSARRMRSAHDRRRPTHQYQLRAFEESRETTREVARP